MFFLPKFHSITKKITENCIRPKKFSPKCQRSQAKPIRNSSHMLHYAFFCNFYRQQRPGTILGKSWDIFKSPSTPNFWHKCRRCSWLPLVPIYCTMLPFGSFIDTLGLEHCWESHRIFWKSPSNQIFWHECRHCSRSHLVPICCTMLPFATFKENQRPGTDPKSFFSSEFFFDENFLPNIFFTKIF